MSVLEYLSNNVAGLQAVNFIKKGLQHMCFQQLCELLETNQYITLTISQVLFSILYKSEK